MTKIEERMLECARALKEYCNGFCGECTECLFDTDDGKCVFHYYNPWEWNLKDCSVRNRRADDGRK